MPNSSSPANLRDFLDILRREGDLAVIDVEVDPKLEAAEIHRRVIAAGGPALLFTRVKGARFPLVTNLFGTRKRVDLAFGSRPREIIEGVARLPHEMLPPSPGKLWNQRDLLWSLAKVGMKRTSRAPVLEVLENQPDLSTLPALTTWSEDGGPFLTLPLVLTAHPGSGQTNLGMYRMQVHGPNRTGIHFQISKGGGYHQGIAEAANQPLPMSCFLGGPPALILAAIAPLPENVPELLLASLVLGRKFPMTQHVKSPLPIPAEAEFALIGEIPPHVRQPEGPFGDHYGYYSLRHDYPVFDVKVILHRSDAIFPATVVGKPRQEDFFIGDYLQDLLSPLFPLVMPAVKDLWSYGETGYHSLAAAVVTQRYKREVMVSAFRILGEGQLALTKFLFLTDQAVDLRNFKSVLETVLERTVPETDIYVFSNLSMDTLDYTGPVVNEGSKGVWLGIGPKIRDLPGEFTSGLPGGVKKVAVFCRGVICVSGPTWEDDREFAARLTSVPQFMDWPLVVLCDDAEKAARSAMNFLWTTFTRFEPGNDIYTASREFVRHHHTFKFPVVIDARMKPGYPAELFCDPETSKQVSRRWTEYFTTSVEMGNSDAAHLD